MSYLAALIIFGFCFAGMAVGLLFAKKALRKGCSADPTDPNATCACKAEEEKQKEQDPLYNIQPKLKDGNE